MDEIAPKMCDFDPVPTSLLYDCFHETVPMLTGVLSSFHYNWHSVKFFKKPIVKPPHLNL